MSHSIPIQSLYAADNINHLICDYEINEITEPVSPVIHSMARLCLIKKGNGKVVINNKEYFVMEGSIVSILPWQIIDVTAVNGKICYEVVKYHFDTINEIVKTFYNPDNNRMSVREILKASPVLTLTTDKYEDMEKNFSVCRKEIKCIREKGEGPDRRNEQLSNLSIINRLIDIFLSFLRANEGVSLDQMETRTDILEYMYMHLNDKLTVSKISKKFFMSESSIRSYIKKTTGYTFNDLLNEMRIGKMINYLLYTHFTVDELAKVLGFVDDSHICKVFKAKTGMKINDFRNEYQIIGEKCHIQDRKIFYEIVEYIYKNHTEDLQIQSVSEVFHISPKELNEILLNKQEQNFNDLLNTVRINHASELLLNTNDSILDISLEVGYKSEKTFSRNFVQVYGMTAGKFRKSVISEQETKFL